MQLWMCFYRKFNLMSDKITKVVLLWNLGYELESKMVSLFILSAVLDSVKLQYWTYVQKVPTVIMGGKKLTTQWARWQEANKFLFLHLTVTSYIQKWCTVTPSECTWAWRLVLGKANVQSSLEVRSEGPRTLPGMDLETKVSHVSQIKASLCFTECKKGCLSFFKVHPELLLFLEDSAGCVTPKPASITAYEKRRRQRGPSVTSSQWGNSDLSPQSCVCRQAPAYTC